MAMIKTVLCPVDFTPVCEREIALAIELCRTFGSRLVLHHNLEAPSPGMAMAWMWNQENAAGKRPQADAEATLRELLKKLPADVQAEACVSDGQVASTLLYLERQLPADLLVMATHGQSTEDHSSLAERLIERSTCPVLVLHDCESEASPIPKAEKRVEVLVPTDWSEGGMQAVEYAFELARTLDWRIHLLHVVSVGDVTRTEVNAPSMMSAKSPGEMLAENRARLDALVPSDLRDRVLCYAELGEPSEKIVEMSRRLEVECIVMGMHARSLLRRFFTHDTSRELLHRAGCPVWFIPGERAAA